MTRMGSPRLLLLTTTTDIGGMPRITTSLARQMRARGWSVRYVFPFPIEPGETLDWYHAQGVGPPMTDVAPRSWLRRTPRDMFALTRFIRRIRPDVVHLHYGDNSISIKDVLAVRLAARGKCVVSVHHPTPLDGVKQGARPETGIGARLTDAVTTFSRATVRSLLEDGAPSSKIHLIPCGLPAPRSLSLRTEARARLGLPPGAFVVGSLARLVREKGIADLVNACARVADPEGRLRLVIAGDGPERVALENLARPALDGRVLFTGRIGDPDDLYAASDVFVLPSYMEGFGLVFVEAAFYGVPSIGTQVGGVPDAIADGETGLLVPPGDVQHLAAAIARLRDDADLRAQLGDTARRRAHAQFTEEHMADQFERLYRA